MQLIRQVVYVLLYLHFSSRDVSTHDIDMLSEEYMSGTNDFTTISNWKCESDNECTVTNSTCRDNECQCAPGYIYNSNMTSCVRVATGLLDPCEDSFQCSAYLSNGGECVDNICVCGPGYYYLHGRCNQYVGLFEKCKENIDCYVNADFEASTCNATEKICECSPGFYQREYRTCRREGKAVGNECTIDIDCTFKNAICKDFVCVEKSESKETNEFSSDIVLTADSNESTGEQIRVGSNCTSDEDCSELGNAVCDLTGACRCVRTYFAPDADAKCIPELGESCRSDDVGSIEKSICRAGIWSCTNGTVASRDNHECRKATTEYNGQCYEKEDCYIFGPDAECNENQCVCNATYSHYVESELFCWGNRGIDETCIQNYDCYVEGFVNELLCKDNKCGCPDDTHMNKNETACIKNVAGIGDICEVNEDCKTTNTICNENVCDCQENYYPSKKREECLAGLNSTCEMDKQCIPADSVCISKVCSCKQDYVPVSIDTCLPTLPYGESCSQNIQCSVIVPGAICAAVKQDSGNKICTCDEKDHYRFGRCFKKKMLSETCTNIGECYLNFNADTVMCMNGECTCNWGYMKWNNSVCLKDKRTLHFLNDGVIKMMSTGLLLVMLLLTSCDIF
ncbi:prion-like-(Q/N-rich) domain-bearing protein 25 [Odontomachus brunneus]|uniref:prion-like-(Q/N-rich) domain-bearing protein 25 n=1 Tax=Odontomachus brunneus TaxID=486640 RepID=UPI0013F2879F|nr:prion-like-(Q/N-rich) domain-bearing protein 25 [Odontomachus brunneus]